MNASDAGIDAGADASRSADGSDAADGGGSDAGALDAGTDGGAICGFLRGPCCAGSSCDPGLWCMQTNTDPGPVCIGCYNCDGGCGASGQPCCIGSAAWAICDIGFRCSGCGTGSPETCVAPPDGGGLLGSPCDCPSDCGTGLLCCGTCNGISACELPTDAGQCDPPPCADGGSGLGSVCNVTADCATGLNCCYPCGTPGCQNQCTFTDGGRCPLFP